MGIYLWFLLRDHLTLHGCPVEVGEHSRHFKSRAKAEVRALRKLVGCLGMEGIRFCWHAWGGKMTGRTGTFTLAAALVFVAANCGRQNDTASHPSSEAEKVIEDVKRGPSYVPAPSAARTLLKKFTVSRSHDGGIEFGGRLFLPQGTSVMFDLLPASGGRLLGQDKVVLGDSGSFRAGPFRSGESPYKAGAFRVQVLSHFTSVWQPPGVLELVGEKGSRLSSHLLIPDDAEFPDAGRHLEVTVPVTIPPLAPEVMAIESVKNAVLVVTGKGRATDPIRTVVQYFAEADVKPMGWSGRRASAQRWIVSYACLNGAKPDTALWEYDGGTGRVRYLNPLAKTLSWLPPE